MAKLSFNSRNFAKQLEKEIKKSVEQDAKKHPERFLDDHVGDQLSDKCMNCGQPKMVIIKGGKAKCTACGFATKVSLDLTWR